MHKDSDSACAVASHESTHGIRKLIAIRDKVWCPEGHQ